MSFKESFNNSLSLGRVTARLKTNCRTKFVYSHSGVEVRTWHLGLWATFPSRIRLRSSLEVVPVCVVSLHHILLDVPRTALADTTNASAMMRRRWWLSSQIIGREPWEMSADILDIEPARSPASGIGLALAKLSHSRGARVLIGDLKLTPEAQTFVDSTPDVKFQKCDVTSRSELAGLNTTSLQHFGDVPDIYAPVAGIFEPPWSNFWDDTEEDGYKTIDVNVNHPIKMTRLAMRALLGANKKGVVCLVASGAGLAGFYLASLYCASKHAIVGFVKSMGLADEEEGVKIMCICPG